MMETKMRDLSRWIVGTSLLVVFSSASQAVLQDYAQNEVQSDIAEAIPIVCSELAENGGLNNPDPNQRDLFSACNAMIQTSNELNGQTGPATDRSLGLSEQELAAALQDLAHEEIITQGTMATETSSAQQANIDMRLSQLLGKVPSISVTGLQFKQNGKTLMADALGFKYGQRGGAAGDGDAGWRKLGVFINGSIGFGEKEGTAREDAFDFDTSGITVGVDYRLTNQLVLGVAAGYNKLGSDIVHTASVSGGSVDADGYSLSGYGLYYLDNFYVNGVITYTSNDYDIERRVIILSNNPSIPTINRTASANTDSDQIAFSATAGYELSREAWTFGPYARFDYLDVDIDGYTETGAVGLNLQVNAQDIKSFTSSLGGQVSYAISQNFGILMPQARLEWVHEFEDDSRSISARYVHSLNPTFWEAPTDSPDRNYFTLGLGVSAVFKGGLQAFFDYGTVLGLENIDDHVFTIGARAEF